MDYTVPGPIAAEPPLDLNDKAPDKPQDKLGLEDIVHVANKIGLEFVQAKREAERLELLKPTVRARVTLRLDDGKLSETKLRRLTETDQEYIDFLEKLIDAFTSILGMRENGITFADTSISTDSLGFIIATGLCVTVAHIHLSRLVGCTQAKLIVIRSKMRSGKWWAVTRRSRSRGFTLQWMYSFSVTVSGMTGRTRWHGKRSLLAEMTREMIMQDPCITITFRVNGKPRLMALPGAMFRI